MSTDNAQTKTMSRKFSFSGTPKEATPHYDAGDPAVKAKGFQMTETSEKVEIHEPNRKYSFSKVSNAAASEPYFILTEQSA